MRVRTASEDLDALMAQLSGLVDDLVARAAGEVDAVALAIPGTLDRDTGTAVAAANLPWRNTPLAEILTRRTGLRTTVGGDGEGATLAEGHFGAAQGQPDYACLLVGTGIGGGVVVDGVLQRGAGRRNPEIGHMIVAPRGPRCRCGGRGCVEAVAAGPAILARARELGSSAADGAAVHAAALRGEPAATRAFAEASEYLAMVLVSLWRLFEPSVFVLGGGVMAAGEHLLAPLRAKMAELGATASAAGGGLAAVTPAGRRQLPGGRRAPAPGGRPRGAGGRGMIKSVSRGVQVLGCFTPHTPRLRLKDIADQLGIPMGSAFRTLRTLETLGFVVQDPVTKQYRLGLKALDLSLACLAGMEFPDVALPFLEELASQTRLSANMAVLDGTEIVFVARASVVRLLRSNLSVGSRLPGHCTAMGKALLAHLDPAEARARFEARS